MLALPRSRTKCVAFLLAITLHQSTVANAQSTSPRTPVDARQSSNTEPSLGAALRHAADRAGLWGSLGIGRASAGLRCTTCANESTRAYVLDGTLGIRLRESFLMGIETFGWLDVFGGGIDRISRGTHLIARFYPLSQDNLFLHGGVGVASFRIYDDEIGFVTRSPSISIGVGYDWQIGNLTLSPVVAAVGSTGGSLRSSRTENAIDENARLTMIRTSVGFSWFR